MLARIARIATVVKIVMLDNDVYVIMIALNYVVSTLVFNITCIYLW